MKTITKKFSLVTVAMLSVTAFAAGAHADESSLGADSHAVRYADWNLNSAAGSKVLYQRIRNAADLVCGKADSNRLVESMVIKACVDKAVVSSVRAVNRAQLTNTANAHGYRVQTSFTLASVR